MAVGAFLLLATSHVEAQTLQNYTPPPMFGGTAPAQAPAPVAPKAAPTPAPSAPARLMAPITQGDPLNKQKRVQAKAPVKPKVSKQQILQVPVHEPSKPQVIATHASETIPRPTPKPAVPVIAKEEPIEDIVEDVQVTATNLTPTPAPEDIIEPEIEETAPVVATPKASQDVRVPDDDFMMPSMAATPARPERIVDVIKPVQLLPEKDVTCVYNEDTQAMLLPPAPIVGEDMSDGRRIYGSPKPALKPLKDELFLKPYIEANAPPPVEIKGEQIKKAGYADVEAEPLPITAADIKRFEALSCPLVPMDAEKTRVTFPAGETVTADGSEEVMASVVKTMQEHGTAKLFIRAYASKAQGQEEIDARRLSLARGLAVRAWIMKQGIFPSRIEIKAMGSMSGEAQSDFVDLIVSD
ncbi:MAG: OmpA family protein [Pseudobdellovibrionaceae bacterium]